MYLILSIFLGIERRDGVDQNFKAFVCDQLSLSQPQQLEAKKSFFSFSGAKSPNAISTDNCLIGKAGCEITAFTKPKELKVAKQDQRPPNQLTKPTKMQIL